MKAVVTVVGEDRVGIIAEVCTHLAEFGVNVLDISQTVMQGYFTMMMVVDVSECKLPLAEMVVLMEEMGLRGREVGEMLSRLLEAVLEDPSVNERQTLLHLAKRLK